LYRSLSTNKEPLLPSMPAIPLVGRVLAAVVLGLGLAVAFAPYDHWWLLAPSVAGLTIVCTGIRIRAAALVGFAYGLSFTLALVPWLTVIGPAAWIALSTLEAVFFGILGVAVCVVVGRPGWPLWVACCWVGTEQLKASIPWGGLPWGRLAFALGETPLAAYARLGGVAMLTGIAVLIVNLALAAVWRRRIEPASGLLIASVAALVTVGWLLPVSSPSDATFTVAVVQGNVPGHGLEAFVERRAVLNNHVSATHQLAASIRSGQLPRPNLVIWPENSTDIDPFADKAAAAAISGAVADVGVPTLVGAVVDAPDGDHLLNMGIVWHPRTGPGAEYVKRHLVPFGEYVPFRSLLAPHISALDQIPIDFAPGSRPGVLRVAGTTIGDVFCFEVAYDNLLRDLVNGGARLLVVQTNNATYLGTSQLPQQWQMSRLRAIEFGRTVAVASTDGISGIVGPDGTVLAESSPATRAVLVRRVPLESGLTPAARFGAFIEWTLSLTGLLAVAASVIYRRWPRTVGSPGEEPISEEFTS
jgi:apolipoprotein N-acyltransferase